MYAGAPLSLGAFRKRLPDADRPYRLPAGAVFSPARVRGRDLDHHVVRLGDQLEARRPGPDRLPADLQPRDAPEELNPRRPAGCRSTWSGSGPSPSSPLQWPHQYGARDGGTTGLAPVLWALVVSAVFALVIYYWAIKVSLPTETIKT